MPQTHALTTHRAGGSTSANSIEDAAVDLFDRALLLPGPSKERLLEAFEQALKQFASGSGSPDGVRDICKAAALSTARGHGNIIETGRVLLGAIDEVGGRLGLDLRRCKENALLGLAEGACQVGPIVYGRFLDIATEYRDNADEWILKNRRRPASFDPAALPVIVPFETELTLKTRSQASSAVEPPLSAVAPQASAVESAPSAVAPASVPVPEPRAEGEGEGEGEVKGETQAGGDPTSPPNGWSRPKGKGFFRRLSDVMGGLFGRRA